MGFKPLTFWRWHIFTCSMTAGQAKMLFKYVAGGIYKHWGMIAPVIELSAAPVLDHYYLIGHIVSYFINTCAHKRIVSMIGQFSVANQISLLRSTCSKLKQVSNTSYKHKNEYATGSTWSLWHEFDNYRSIGCLLYETTFNLCSICMASWLSHEFNHDLMRLPVPRFK